MKYNGNNLEDVLEAHKRWFNGSNGWSEDDRADLRGANLSRSDLSKACLTSADLRGIDLSEANLIGADLSGACLMGAYLMRTSLSGANLIRADLRGSDLSGAYLIRADLRGAMLNRANLRAANLNRANLSGACLTRVDLSGTCLSGVNLRNVNLNRADLREADLKEAINIPYMPLACPDSGAFVGWKKCRTCGKNNNVVIVKLLITEDAKRCSSTGRKCRADKAVVLEIQNLDGTKADKDVAYSAYKNQDFAYKIGETVFPEKPFEDDRWKECASGIHFFINREEAVNY